MRTRQLIAAIVFALCAAARAPAQTTLVPDPPQFVTGPDIQTMDWSPSGRYLLVTRLQAERWVFDREPRSTASVVLWDQQKRQSKWLMTTQQRVPEVHWLARTNDAIVVVQPVEEQDTTTELWRVDARTGTVTRVPGVTGIVHVSTSPTEPWAVAYGLDDDGGFVQSLSAAGALGPRVALTEPAADFDAWSSDGQTAYFRHTPRPDDLPDPATIELFAPGTPDPPPDPDPIIPAFPAFTPATGQMTSLNRIHEWYREPPPNRPFDLTYSNLKTTGAPRDKSPETAPWSPVIRPLWLVQKGDTLFTRLFIAADVDRHAVSPRNDAVAYQNAEGAFVVPLVRVPTATLRQARLKAEMSQILNNSKQIGLALIMWAQDNGDAFPPGGSDLGALINPYLKDSSILAGNGGFHYTFGGGLISGIENPAETPLGYFDGPGGRACVYVDGHVMWRQ